jgi:hypothetical protein
MLAFEKSFKNEKNSWDNFELNQVLTSLMNLDP